MVRLRGIGLLSVLSPGGRRRLVRLLIVVVLLMAALIWLTAGVSLPDDGEAIPATSSSAVGFLTKVTEAGRAAAGSRQITLDVTDVEVTSFLQIGAELAEQSQDAGENVSIEDLAERGDEVFDQIPGGEALRDLLSRRDALPDISDRDLRLRATIKDPEVRFLGDGTVIVRGTGNLWFLNVPARVVVAPRIEDGRLVFDFVEGQLGRLGLPEAVVDRAGEALVSLILAGQEYAEITDISVRQGALRLQARGG